MHPEGLIGTLFSKCTYSIGSAAVAQRRGGRRTRLGEGVIRLGEGAAGRWIYFVLFDVAHVDRPADEAAQAGAPGQRIHMLELICCRDVTVACCSAWSTLCADRVLLLAARVRQATL